MKICSLTKEIYAKYCDFLQNYASSALLLVIRIYIALVFYKSGLVKFDNVDSAILLFEYEYQVPLLPPVFAAYSAMFFELACSILLMAGLFSRLAALPLIAMAAVIEFTYQHNVEHFYWMMLLAVLGVYGSGALSLDCILRKFSCKK